MAHENVVGINLVGTLIHEVRSSHQRRYFFDSNLIVLLEDGLKESGQSQSLKTTMIATLILQGLVTEMEATDSMLVYWSDAEKGEYQGSAGYWIVFSKLGSVTRGENDGNLVSKPVKKWWQVWK